jgi:hypothetical protein
MVVRSFDHVGLTSVRAGATEGNMEMDLVRSRMATPSPPTNESRTNTAAQTSDHRSSGSGSLGAIALVLSVIALVLGGSGLGLALTTHGTTGPAGGTGPTGGAGTTGPQGPQGARGTTGQNGTPGVGGTQGPAGPGSLIASSTSFPYVVFYASTGCWNTTPPQVNSTVPSSGTVAVQADFVASWGHSSGVSDELEVFVSNSLACSGAPYYSIVSGADPSGGFQQSGQWEQTFAVGAGKHTFYVVALVIGGTDGIEFWDVALNAVFYPS